MLGTDMPNFPNAVRVFVVFNAVLVHLKLPHNQCLLFIILFVFSEDAKCPVTLMQATQQNLMFTARKTEALLSIAHGEVLVFCHNVTRSHQWTFPKQYTYPLNKTSTGGNTFKQFMQHYTCAFGETLWSDVRPVS